MKRRVFIKSLAAFAVAASFPVSFGDSVSEIATQETYSGIVADDIIRYMNEIHERVKRHDSLPNCIIMPKAQYDRLLESDV